MLTWSKRLSSWWNSFRHTPHWNIFWVFPHLSWKCSFKPFWNLKSFGQLGQYTLDESWSRSGTGPVACQLHCPLLCLTLYSEEFNFAAIYCVISYWGLEPCQTAPSWGNNTIYCIHLPALPNKIKVWLQGEKSNTYIYIIYILCVDDAWWQKTYNESKGCDPSLMKKLRWNEMKRLNDEWSV